MIESGKFHVRNPMIFMGLMLAIVIACGVMSPAHALTFSSPTGNVTCDIGDEAFAVKVVYCVKMAVFNTTELFLEQTSAAMYPMTLALMIFVATLLGVRIATGERDPQKMVMGFLLKFGVVLLFADNFGAAMGGLTDDVFRIMEQMQAIAIPALYEGQGTGVCDLSGAGGPAGGYIIAITYDPWEYIDCVFDYIFGFGVQATIASSIFGFIGSAFFGGYMGVMIFFMGVALVLSIALFAFRCVYVTLLAYIMAGYLIVLSPLFIPTLMFKVTERMFVKWLYNLINAIFLPFMMVAYLGFAMPVLDQFVFGDGDQALTATLGQGDEILEKYRLAAPICETSAASDFEFFKVKSPDRIIGNLLNPTESGAMDWCGMFDFTKVDMGKEHIQELWEVGMSLLRILVAAFLILAVAKKIPELSAFIIGGGGGHALANSAQAPMPFESAMKGTLRQAAHTSAEGAGQSRGIFGGVGGVMNLMGNR